MFSDKTVGAVRPRLLVGDNRRGIGLSKSNPQIGEMQVQQKVPLTVLNTVNVIINYGIVLGMKGTAVTQLYYKSEGRWFDSRWCHWNFSLT